MPARALVCRGCCCGTSRKHPDVDHDAQVAALAEVAHVRIVDCVDQCAHSNVVVVRPGSGVSLWFGRVLDRAVVADLCRWLAAGAPLPVPGELEPHLFDRHAPHEPEPVLLRARA